MLRQLVLMISLFTNKLLSHIMKELFKPFNFKDNMPNNILISGLTNKIKFNIEK
jgi:hypothetical protein